MSYSYHSSRQGSASKRWSHGTRAKPANTRGRKLPSEYIDPSRFVKVASAAEADVYVPTHTFADFALVSLLQTNLAKSGYHTPSPIQDQAIPVGLSGRDVIGLASTGTGKTAAFALPVLQRLMTDPATFALVIAPTRELAQQLEEGFRTLAKGSGLGGALLIGGAGMGAQLRDLRAQPRVVIGTPGRIKDHIQRGTLKLERFNMVVLDEVDRMLDMGFVHAITEILRQTSSRRQSFFFSATIDARVRQLIDTFANDPVQISLKPSSASENVHQDIVRYQTNVDKLEKLHDLLTRQGVDKVIVFDETQRSVERLAKTLEARGFSVDSIHGGKTQGQRQRAMAKFKQNHIAILVATDVAARGIDVADVTHVVNYSIPKVYDDYIHRIGRAGRAGQIGYALTFVTHGGNQATFTA